MRIRSYDPELQRAYQDSIILIKSLPAHSYIDYGKEVVCQWNFLLCYHSNKTTNVEKLRNDKNKDENYDI